MAAHAASTAASQCREFAVARAHRAPTNMPAFRAMKITEL